MEETSTNLTATTSEFGDERSDGRVGVTIRNRVGREFEFLAAAGVEGAWTGAVAGRLLADNYYEVSGEWEDINDTGGDDPIWEAAVIFADNPEEGAESPAPCESRDCPVCYHGWGRGRGTALLRR